MNSSNNPTSYPGRRHPKRFCAVVVFVHDPSTLLSSSDSPAFYDLYFAGFSLFSSFFFSAVAWLFFSSRMIQSTLDSDWNNSLSIDYKIHVLVVGSLANTIHERGREPGPVCREGENDNNVNAIMEHKRELLWTVAKNRLRMWSERPVKSRSPNLRFLMFYLCGP